VISSNEFRHQETRAGLLELIQEELVGPYLNGGADSFAVMFMQTAGNTLEHQLRSHHEQMCSQRQRREERKRDINERSRIACSSRESSFLLDLAAHLEALDPYWLEFHGEPFEWRGGLKLVRGTDKEWPADAAYNTKLETFTDSHEVFDSLRQAFFIPSDSLAKLVAEAVYELADQRADSDVFCVIADGILAYLHEEDSCDITWSIILQRMCSMRT